MPKPPPITDAEWSLMDALWAESPRTASGLHEELSAPRDWSLATVKTLLSRLTAKGAIRYVKEGKRFHYWPAVTRAAAVKAEGKSLMRRAGRDAHTPLIAYFLRQGKLREDEIAELRTLLDELDDGGAR